jgi:energy-coupling factor transporter ATP-binding protein EcfA2
MIYSTMNGKPITKADLRREFGTRAQIHDITEEFNRLAIPRKIPNGYHTFHQIAILGRPGSGKSVLAESLAELTIRQHGEHRTNLVYTDSLPLAVEHMDSRPVQLLIVDDASGGASGRRTMSEANVQTVQDLNTLRHKLADKQVEDNAQHYGGMVIVIIAWQRETDLDKALRQADFRIWKTPPMEHSDRMALEGILGRPAVDRLNRISYKMLHGDNEVKAQSIGAIMSIGRDAGGVGIHTMPRTDYRLPPILKQADVEEAERKAQEEAERLDSEALDAEKRTRKSRTTPDTETVIILHKAGLSNRQIADKLGCSRSPINAIVKDFLAQESPS